VGIQNTSPPSAVDYWGKIKILSDKPEIYIMKEIALKVKKALSLLFNFEFVYDCLKYLGLINEMLSYE